MYQPPAFQELRPEAVDRLIGAYPLAAITAIAGGGVSIDHLPLLKLDQCLQGHVARSNPLAELDGVPVIAVFQGPQAYISPAWYPDKAISGKVVPTWNYAVAHLHGRLRLRDDPAWVLDVLARQTRAHESAQAEPWSLTDAPADYVRQLARAVVGVEIVIEQIEAKFKLSQNKSAEVRERIAAGLQARALSADLQLADWMQPDPQWADGLGPR